MAKEGVALEFLGAAETVTGSRILVKWPPNRIMVDCGLFQGSKDNRNRNWQPFAGAAQVEAIFLTHAHVDHSGFLPKLVKDGFRGPIYCSPGTAALAQIMLMDAAHLQEEDAHFANRTKHSSHDPALPLFDTSDAELALTMLQPREVREWHTINDHLAVQFIPSGHILGSTYVLLKGSDGRTILFSGDIGNGRSRVIKDPDPPPYADCVVMEGTYGDRQQEKTDPLIELGVIVNRVCQRGGTVVIPAFSVGRTQEILFLLSELERTNQIAPVPVYLDSPMSNSATAIYIEHEDELKISNGDIAFRLKSFHQVRTTDESMLLCMSTEPKVVISAAGMLTGGRILHHLSSKLPDSRSAVLFVGYQAEGTKGRLLRHGLKKIRIHHHDVDVEAEILFIDSLSAHADSDDLVAWVKKIKPAPKMVILNHGEKPALEALQYRLRHEAGLDSLIAKDQTPIVLS